MADFATLPATATAYSKPTFVQCNATYRHLEKRGVWYEAVEMSQDLEALNRVRALGYPQAPMVMIQGRHHAFIRVIHSRALPWGRRGGPRAAPVP